jgi:predicted flap endonuclease-1-like 5' DNA nuclease/soluble cytochrome b562
MKLTEIAIEGNTHSGRFRFGPLDRGLNFVYGENGAGKTFLGSFLRGLLQPGSNRNESAIGHAACTVSQGAYTLRHTSGSPNSVLIEPLQNAQASVSSVGQLTGNVTPIMHDTLFNFSLRDCSRLRHDLAQILHDNFSVAIGPDAADSTAQVNHQPQIDQLNTELAQVRASIDTLNATRVRIVDEISGKQSDKNRLADLNQQIDSVTAQLNQLNRVNLQTRLANIDQEIQNLQSSIDQAATSYVTHTQVQNNQDGFKHLYQRLDEVDQQIERWRNVQSDIQNQRVRLKDEMLVWNEMTLESDDHPYHNAREILVGLESQVDKAEQTAARWSGVTASQIDVTQMATAVEDICRQMREDLYSLCAELSSQYKHIRQRAAAEELKQLRRCYHEMGENTARLLQRRNQVIDEIRTVDPAGADAIIRSEQAFCNCAAHEGYLAARRRFIGDLRPSAPVVTRVETDFSAERNRLAQLNVERNEIVASLNRIDTDGLELDRRLSTLIQQRDSISVSDLRLLEGQLNRADQDLSSLQTQERSLRQQIDDLAAIPVVQPSPILIQAGQVLSQMTDGELSQVFVAHHTGHDSGSQRQFDLQIRDAMGRVHNFTGIDGSSQDRVYLSVALAVVSSLRSSSIEMPMIIDDSFIHIGPEHVTATLNTLDQYSRQRDQQIILLSQHRYLADRLPTMPVFELPPSVPTTAPQEAPTRTNPLAFPTERYSQQFSSTGYDIPSLADTQSSYPVSVNNRPYPLSKYSVDPTTTGPAVIANITEPENDFRLPWSPLNRTATQPDSNGSVRATSARAFAERQPSPTPVAIDTMSLAATGLFELAILGDFHDAGVTTVEQLLELDPEQLGRSFAKTTLTTQQIETAQSEALIFWSVSGISADEAKLIVAIGFADPESLADTDADRLVARIHQFLASDEGRSFQRSRASNINWSSFDRGRASGWQRSLSNNRSRWSRRPRRSRRSRSDRSRSWQPANQRSRRNRSSDHAHETYRLSHYPQRQRMDHGNFEREDRTRQPAAMRPAASRRSQNRTSSATTSSKNTQSSDVKLKFYLDLNDDLEAAPSIGPKTAERFQKIGVISVADFLRQTAESMATRLNYKRLSADVLRTWQHQTRMVCRIPNLRGHDAQLLVACDVIEPDDLAAMDPTALFGLIGPFSDTKEGLKIIRSGKKPDLAEVTDWISWAAHTRSLQAA